MREPGQNTNAHMLTKFRYLGDRQSSSLIGTYNLQAVFSIFR